MSRRLPLVLPLLLCAAAATAQTPEVHGEDSAFAAPGVLVVWGMLRGATEDETQVVLRIAPVGGRFTHARVEAVDPFVGARRPVAGPLPLGRSVDIRMPRASFGDFPRREILLYATEAEARGGRPALTVYYLGVPDTTPELASEAALAAHLAEALRRLER